MNYNDYSGFDVFLNNFVFEWRCSYKILDFVGIQELCLNFSELR